MQTDDDGQNQRGFAQGAVATCIGGTDGHALGYIVQRNGTGHHDACHEQTQFAVTPCVVSFQMVAVDQLVQIVGSFGVVLINVRNFGVGFGVDEVIEKVSNTHTDGNGDRGNLHVGGFNGFGDQIETDNAEHNTARETKQQTDGTFGILLQQCAGKTAQTGAANTCQCGGENQCS